MSNCNHNYVYLRQETCKSDYGYWFVKDVFYCSKCLQYRDVTQWVGDHKVRSGR